MTSRAEFLLEELEKTERKIEVLKEYMKYLEDQLRVEDKDAYNEMVFEKEMRFKL